MKLFCFMLVPAGLFAATCGMAKPGASDAKILVRATHKVLIENELVRIIDVNIPAGKSEPAYPHAWPALVIEDHPRSGERLEVRNFKSSWEVSKSKAHEGPAHYLSIELKKADCLAVKNPPLPPTDGVVIHDPSIKVPFENDYVRVLEIEVKPGEAEPPHTHTWPSVVYYYRLPPSKRGTADGKPPVDRPELKEQSVTFEDFAQPVHTLQNTGTYLYQAHRIEIKPVTPN